MVYRPEPSLQNEVGGIYHWALANNFSALSNVKNNYNFQKTPVPYESI